MKKIIVFLMMFFSFNLFALNIQNEKKEIVKYEDVIKNVKGDAIINYDALWCPHCQQNLVELKEFQEKRPNVKIIIIFTDLRMEQAGYYNKIDDVIKYMKEHKYNFTIYYDYNNDIFKNYKIKGVPVQNYIKNGKLENKDFGETLSLDDLMYKYRKY